jgi:catechol 2,3-dioxygenase-like lactoylglutathione lyase family enzyme
MRPAGCAGPMTIPPRISLVTMGVEDVAGATRFYERLGWPRAGVSTDEVSFFRTGGAILAVWGRAALAEDARVAATGDGFRRLALAINVATRDAVDAALAAAERAGGRVTRPARDAEWGGRSGYFADPEGNLWEVAWNPHFPLQADGSVRLPD